MESGYIKSRQMDKAMRIFEALSGVDEELLARSEERNEAIIPGVWRYTRAIAACFCLIAAGGLVWGVYKLTPLQDKAAEQAVPQALNESVQRIADNTEGVPYDLQDGAKEAAVIANEDGNGGLDVKQVEQSGNAPIKNEVTEKIFLDEGMNNGVFGEKAYEEKDSADELKLESACGMLLDSREKVSEEEARATEGLGSYIPALLPSGYGFESARREENPDNGEYDSISIVWSKGMDSVFLFIEKVDPANVALTDLDKPETYNVHLYDIPYSQTLPQEYYDAFHNPVFRAGDLSLELIEARMKTIQDAGDSDTPRGDFSVLYDEGILVRFNGDGTPQEIWEMFSSVEP